MLNDATCFREVYIVCGYTDLRSGMDRLAAVIEAKTGTSPYVPGALYLFCGRRLDRSKGLVWEGDGYCTKDYPKINSSGRVMRKKCRR